MLPTIRGDRGLLPWIHVDDAAQRHGRGARARARRHAVYDIVDDEPVSFSEIVDALSPMPRARRGHSRFRRGCCGLLCHTWRGMSRLRLPLSNPKARTELGGARRIPTIGEGCADASPRGMRHDESIFSTHRPALFAVAYRMLGSASDAEDVVQDAWLRYRRRSLRTAIRRRPT